MVRTIIQLQSDYSKKQNVVKLIERGINPKFRPDDQEQNVQSKSIIWFFCKDYDKW